MIRRPSPNYGQRRGGAGPELVVLHGTAMESAEAALERLCAPEFQVSAHYLISSGGRTYCLVDEEFRAWHAGAGSWGGMPDVNSRSIGIELDNDGQLPFPEPQMAALETLLKDILDRWSIPPERVIAHSDMAPSRKRDPGPKLDWRRLSLAHLSVWPGVDPQSVSVLSGKRVDAEANEAEFREAAMKFGYPDVDTETLLAAFRLRFLPQVKGGISGCDLAAARFLARRFPVDRTQAGS